jgi:type IV secretory pathway VirB4 component
VPQVPVFRGSTGQLCGLYPWLYGGSLPAAGACIGIDCLTGGAFSCHPLAWLADGLVSNPNLLFTGLPGAGKSATAKALALRLMAYGVRTFVCGDLKNEYAPLARALGTEPVELGPGLPGRLNPLDAGPLGENLPRDPARLAERLAEIHRRRLVLLCSLAAMRLGRPLTPTEETAVSLAIHEASGRPASGAEGEGAGAVRGGALGAGPTIPAVWAVLRDPTPDMARELRVPDDSATRLREMTRPVTDALGGMVHGALAGLFDGPTTVRPDFSAPVQTVDLSRMADRGDDTVAMILACVSSWAQAAVDEPGPARMIVRDELWRSLRIPALVRKIDSDLRLSRAQGTIQLLATHRLADFETAAPAGSAEAAIAAGLIASCDTRVCLAQDTAPLAATRQQIGLTDTECAHIASWSGRQAGRAVWKVGRAASAVVQVVLTPAERELFYTNERMGIG